MEVFIGKSRAMSRDLKRGNIFSRLPSGWRKSAIVNIGLMSTCATILLGILIAAVAKTGQLKQAWVFFEGDCREDGTKTMNTLLHLLINALSTVVLASSNFFMQVLNAPSRPELDASHARGKWLDIGIVSWRNAISLSKFKLAAWIALCLTSIPIHMLFNSSVFQITSRSGDFHVVIASEGFLRGEPYSFPGADLMLEEGRFVEDIKAEKNLVQRRNISDTAARAPGWERLDMTTCQRIYKPGPCSGLSGHRNLVIVIDGPGWRREDLWNFTAKEDSEWEPFVPRHELNPLLLGAQCNMSGTISSGVRRCFNDCYSVFENSLGPSEPTDPWDLAWDSRNTVGLDKHLRWNIPLEVSYCMAERTTPTCSVALSKPLLTAVVLAIMLKVAICIVVVAVIGPQESLVTPGDAVASFISIQDGGTISGPVTQDMIRQRKRTKSLKGAAAYSPLEPQEWIEKQTPRAQAIPRGVWIRTYAILLTGFAATVVCLQQQLSNRTPLQGIKLNADEASNILYPVTGASPFLSSVIVANIPQLYLSFWYIVYNTLITRLVMSQEWALLSIDHRPLRVTQPKGQQIATYRLQLPYKHSVPLLVLSTLGHWLVSNALFVIVSQGSYYLSYSGTQGTYARDDTSLPANAAVAIGTASLPVLILTILGAIMILWPILLSRKVLPGYMPIVGSNSLAISAACRVSPLAQVPRSEGHEIGEDAKQPAHKHVDRIPTDDSTRRDNELEELVPPAETSPEVEEGCGGAGDIALHPLKWGEVKMPEDWYTQEGQDLDNVGHLSFGTVLDDPQPPVNGRWYR